MYYIDLLHLISSLHMHSKEKFDNIDNEKYLILLLN